MSQIQDPSFRYHNPDNDPRGPYLFTDMTSPVVRPNLQYEWRGHLPPEGRSWRFTAERMAELEADGRITYSGSGMPRLKRYLSEAQQPEQPPEPPPTSAGLELIIRTTMRSIACQVARNPALLQEVEWRDLERVLREVFEGLGFETRLTRPAKDGGFDLELRFTEQGEPRVYLVEVKHWVQGSRPGLDIVSDLFEVVVRQGASGGVLLSSSGFTQGARTGRTEIVRQNVRLGGGDKIVSLCQHFIENEAGLMVPVPSLPDMLLAGTY